MVFLEGGRSRRPTRFARVSRARLAAAIFSRPCPGRQQGGWTMFAVSTSAIASGLPRPSIVPAAALLILMMVFPAAAASTTPEQAGTALARKVDQRPDGQSMATAGTMILKSPDGEPRTRQYFLFRQDESNGGKRTLIRFTEPADIAGTGLLVHDHPDAASDEWIYLPALGRVRRISSSRLGGRFVGSDIYYEDLQTRQVSEDHHRLTGEATVHGIQCKIVESVPKDSTNSVYTKRVSWIDPHTLLPLRVDYYQGGDKPSKRLTALKIERIQGFWTMTDSVMTDLNSGSSTRLTLDRVRYNPKLPASLFNTRTLADPTLDRPYRP